MSDDEKLYKTAEERAAEAKRDPIVRLAAFVKAEGIATDAQLDALAREVDAEVNAAADEARKAEKPSPESASLYVYSPDVDPTSAAFDTPALRGKPDTMVAAINRTLKDEMARDPRIVVFGEDVADCQPRGGAGPSPARAACSRSRTDCSGFSASDARLQFAARRSQHHRPRASVWPPRI